jgi:hypothetical protein
MDRETNETPGSESKGGRQKLHLGPPYKTNMRAPLARVFGLRGQKHAEPPSVNLLLKRFVRSSRTKRSNEEKYFSPRVINFFEVGWLLARQNARLKY